MTGLKLPAAVALLSGMSSLSLAAQQMLTPDDTLVPIGVAIVLMVTAVAATAKVVQFVERVDSRFDRHEERLSELEDGR